MDGSSASDPPRPQAVGFDRYVDDYDRALQLGLSISGEDKEYFAEQRVRWTGRRLSRLGCRPRTVLDFGCGTGSTAPLLLRRLDVRHVIGVDSSRGLLERARREHGSDDIRFVGSLVEVADDSIDLVYCNGVFHHIAPSERQQVVDAILNVMAPGGWFALWENNPLSPATRYVMSRIPFDRDAALLFARTASRMLRSRGFRVEMIDYAFFLPRWLAALRFIRPWLHWFPLGMQYLVLAQKPRR